MAEAGAAVEPVIVAELVDLDAPLVRRLMRHRLCHHQGLGRRLVDDGAVVDQMRRRSSVELMGRKRQVRLSRAEENKGRHCLGRAMRVPGGEARLCARRGALGGDAMRCGAGSVLDRRVTSREGKNPMLSDQGSVRFREARAAKSDNAKVC